MLFLSHSSVSTIFCRFRGSNNPYSERQPYDIFTNWRSCIIPIDKRDKFDALMANDDCIRVCIGYGNLTSTEWEFRYSWSHTRRASDLRQTASHYLLVGTIPPSGDACRTLGRAPRFYLLIKSTAAVQSTLSCCWSHPFMSIRDHPLTK